MLRSVALCLATLASLLPGTLQGPHQRFLLRELLRDYNPMERPVANDSHALIVHFSLTLMQVMDVDEKNQILTTNAWLQMWYDHYLQWNQSEYPGVKNLRFTADQVWTPDILLYNSAHNKFDATFKTNVLVNSSGFCEYLPPGIFISTCNVDVRWFPFDIQRCELKFGSWTFDGWLLDIQMKEADVSGYMPNGEWDLLEVPGSRHEMFYECCAEPYPDVTFVVTLRRRTLYYALNLLIPCVLLSSMTLLVFLLPANSGEKISLDLGTFVRRCRDRRGDKGKAGRGGGDEREKTKEPCITVLLSLTVFMLMVAEIMPATSDSIPLIGQYFASTMVIVGMSVVATVIVLQFHHHNPNNGQIPHWVNLVLLQWVPWFLRMKRPGEGGDEPLHHSQADTQSKTLSSPASAASAASAVPTPLSLASLRASLAQLHPSPPQGCVLLPHPNLHPQANGHLPYMGFRAFPCAAEMDAAGTSERRGAAGEEVDGDPPNHQHFSPGSPLQKTSASLNPESSTVSPGTGGADAAPAPTPTPSHAHVIRGKSADGQLQALLLEVQFLVERVREQDRQLGVAEQWQFAAAVIDRLCLVGFSIFNIICTIAILMAAPNFGEALAKDFL
uniref:neuronal acetylcholine receptor subunit alpha-7-like isoform X2 n=1 Tax=Doryrhamphus excisus TaxID=161450 RepID=UPI0025AE88F9|nr:neuronal acetylcholine receptor subunit alpha-7-like isoform X2 [Doryrhamphus excisus]